MPRVRPILRVWEEQSSVQLAWETPFRLLRLSGYHLGSVAGRELRAGRNSRISAIASLSPQRFTGASGGKAESRREGVAPSRITKQPLSAAPRMRRPNA